MLNIVKQNGERMSGFVGVRMPTPILVKFSDLAVADGRTPSGLMRKLATDFVAASEMCAVPPDAPTPQDAQPSQIKHPIATNPWDI